MRPLLSAAIAGLLFSLGLGLGGMTDPAKVIGFLDVAGTWDPSLAFVMAGAVGVHALLRPRVLRRGRPFHGERFSPCEQTRVDRKLLAGAALFGIGWGLAGYCPGPALASVGAGATEPLIFVAAMLGGMAIHRLQQRPVPAAVPVRDATPDGR